MQCAGPIAFCDDVFCLGGSLLSCNHLEQKAATRMEIAARLDTGVRTHKISQVVAFGRMGPRKSPGALSQSCAASEGAELHGKVDSTPSRS